MESLEKILPYALGLIGLIVAIYGVLRGAIDRTELRLSMTEDMLYDCRDDLDAAQKKIKDLEEQAHRLEEQLHRQEQGDKRGDGVRVINISGKANVRTGKDIVAGDIDISRDSNTANDDITTQ